MTYAPARMNGRYYVPTIKSGPSIPTSCRHKVPRNQQDQAIAAHLSAAFRTGDIYAYSYERGQWLTWATELDWAATERSTANGRIIRDRQAHDAGHGPQPYTGDNLTIARPKRPTKAEAIALLRAIYDGNDWQVSDLEQLLAREKAA